MMRLARAVLQHAPKNLTPSEHLLLLTLGLVMNDDDRTWSGDVGYLIAWTGMDRANGTSLVRGMARKGLELRVAPEDTRRYWGRNTQLRLPAAWIDGAPRHCEPPAAVPPAPLAPPPPTALRAAGNGGWASRETAYDQYRGKPTMYKGIRMRSILESDAARFLDRIGIQGWDYEGMNYADETGRYQYDFRLPMGDRSLYLDVKPRSSTEPVRSVLGRMNRIVASEPKAWLGVWYPERDELWYRHGAARADELVKAKATALLHVITQGFPTGTA